MILDELYTDVLARLLDAERPSLGIATVDWDNEQPERLEDGDQADGLRLPAVLFSYQEPEWRHAGRLGYRADTTFQLRVVRDMVNEGMASDASPERIAAMRASYQQVHDIAKRVVGLNKPGVYGTVGLAAKDTDHSFRRIRVEVITFRVLLHNTLDPNTYELRERPALAIGTNPPMPVPTLLQQRIDSSTPAQVVAAINASPKGPAIEEELCNCGDPSEPVEIRNSEGTALGTVQGGDPPFTAPDGVLRTTDNSTIIQTIPSGKVEQVAQSRIRYTAADGTEQLTAASNTGYAAGTLRPALVVPRITIYEADGVTPHTYRDIQSPAFTLPLVPPGDPIIYAFGRWLWSGQITSYRAGDEGSMLAAGWFDHAFVAGHNSIIQRLATYTTLVHPNIHGNHARFTSRTGGAVAGFGDRFMQDHYTGLEYFLTPWTAGVNWNSFIDSGVGIDLLLGEDGWWACPINVLNSLSDYSALTVWTAAPLNAPSPRTIWSSTTAVNSTTNAWGVTTALGAILTTGKTTTTNMLIGIYCRKFF